ncbi:MAG: DUF885 family protein, partial [Rhizomicrobium sp.]
MLNRRHLLLSGSAAVLATMVPAGAKPSDEAAKMNVLFDSFINEQMEVSPEFATGLGLDKDARAWLKSRLSEVTPVAADANKALTASQLNRLKTINRKKLKGLDATNYDAVYYQLEQNDRANKKFAFIGAPYVLHQLGGSYQSLPDFLDSQHTIETKEDADAYLARLDAFGTMMDQEAESVRHDVAMGVIPPDFVIDRTLEQMAHLRGVEAEKSPLVDSVIRRTKEKNIPGNYGAEAVGILNNVVYPALSRQIELMKSLRPKAVHDAGIWRLPQGDELYAAALEAQTTTTKTPEEVHQLGLEVVKDCTSQIEAIMKSQGMTNGTVGQRLRAMFDDPKFRYENTDAAKEKLIADLNVKIGQVQAELPAYFGAKPKAGVQVKRVPKYIEAGAPGGYYNSPSLDGSRPGFYYINLRDTAEVPSWTLPTLTFHESIPGHHLQISIAQEAPLPMLRKISQYNAYVEGWALYAEQLAVEMGLYQNDPMGHIGQLHDAMLRGVRLVVDTGMHAKKWSREQAIRYYADTLGDPDSGATTEIERYCVWPGQACGYMIGKITILRLRDMARAKLGSKFDIHKFHDTVLL